MRKLLLQKNIALIAEDKYLLLRLNNTNKKTGIIFFLILLISYTLCLLVCFPGVGMNDGLNIMYYGVSKINQYPAIYCLYMLALMKVGLHFGTLQITIIIYSIIQMIICALLGSGIVYWICKKNVPIWVKWLSLIFYSAAPIIPIYSIALVKDSVFSLLLVILAILIYEMIKNEKRLIKNNIIFTIILLIDIAGLIILRNNGAYIMIPCLFFLFIFVKKFRKQFIMGGALTAALMILINAIHIHYNSEKLFQEAVGIPIQQIAATVVNNGMIGEREKEIITNVMKPDDIKKAYDPTNSDPIKWSSKFNRGYLNANKTDFLKTWLKLMPDNFRIYVKAYVDQTYWFWIPDPRGTVQTFTTIYQTDNPWLPDWQDANGIHDAPIIRGFVGKILKNYYFLSKYFLREGILFWVMVASLIVYRIRSKNRKAILIYMPLLILWGTIMTSTPINNSMRYVFAFVYALTPIYIGLMFIRER